MTRTLATTQLDLRGRTLDLTRPRIMGVINITPDSFYAGSRCTSPSAARAAAIAMVGEGADLLDLGAMSSRPGSGPVPPDVEIARLIPALEAVRAAVDVPLSIDTYQSEVAIRAVDAGADCLNDITGLRDGDRLARLAAEHRLGLVVMHMRGTPLTMQADTQYNDLIDAVRTDLRVATKRATAAGVEPHRLVVDPGIGFGKSAEGNIALLASIGNLRELGYPVLIGASRKSFIGALTGAEIDDRLPGSLAAAVSAVLAGADLIRAHDVGETAQAVGLATLVRDQSRKCS